MFNAVLRKQNNAVVSVQAIMFILQWFQLYTTQALMFNAVLRKQNNAVVSVIYFLLPSLNV